MRWAGSSGDLRQSKQPACIAHDAAPLAQLPPCCDACGSACSGPRGTTLALPACPPAPRSPLPPWRCPPTAPSAAPALVLCTGAGHRVTRVTHVQAAADADRDLGSTPLAQCLQRCRARPCHAPSCRALTRALPASTRRAGIWPAPRATCRPPPAGTPLRTPPSLCCHPPTPPVAPTPAKRECWEG